MTIGEVAPWVRLRTDTALRRCATLRMPESTNIMSVDRQIKSRRTASCQTEVMARLPSGTYILVTVSLMLFLLMLVLSGKRSTESTVTAEFGCALPAPAGGTAKLGDNSATPVRGVADQMAKRLVSAASVAKALSALEARYGGQSKNVAQPAVSTKQIQQTMARLSAAAIPTSPFAARVELECRGPDAHWSQTLLDELARQFLLERPESTSSGHRPTGLGLARWRVDQAKHYERKSLLDLEDYWQRMTDVHQQSATMGGVARASFQSAVSSESLANGQPQLELAHSASDTTNRKGNPEWSALQEQLADLAAQVDQLLDTVTPNHPRVKALSRQMADIRDRLADTPQYIHTSDNVEAADVENSVATPAPDAVDEQHQRLMANYRAAVTRREQAEAELWHLIDSGNLALAADSQPVSRWMAMPPTVTHRRQRNLQPTTLAVCGIIACVGGLVCVRLRRSLRPLLLINTVDELRRSVAIPIVGQLTLDAASRHARGAVGRLRLLRVIVVATEVSLLVMLALFVIGVLAETPVAVDFRTDPLGVFTEAIAAACVRWW